MEPDELREEYEDSVLDYFSQQRPQIEWGEILFSHTFPNLDCRDPAAYYLGPALNNQQAHADVFSQFPHQVFIMGHFHCWYAADRNGTIDWHGEGPLRFRQDQKYIIVISPVMHGAAAIVDDVEQVLIPVQL